MAVDALRVVRAVGPEAPEAHTLMFTLAAKLKDAELLGLPYALVVGRTWEKEQLLELRDRRAGESRSLGFDEAVDAVCEAVLAERPGLEPEAV